MQYFILLLCLPLFFGNEREVDERDVVPGYIVFQSGKRKEGLIKVGKLIENEQKVLFVSGHQNLVKKYLPDDLLAYGYEMEIIDDFGLKSKKWVHYEKHKVDFPPVPFGKTTIFLEKEIEGPLSLFCYYYEVQGINRTYYQYVFYLKNKEGELALISKDCFKSCAKELFEGYTALAKKIGEKGFEFSNIDRIVKDYNFWLSNKHDKNEYKVALE